MHEFQSRNINTESMSRKDKARIAGVRAVLSTMVGLQEVTPQPIQEVIHVNERAGGWDESGNYFSAQPIPEVGA